MMKKPTILQVKKLIKTRHFHIEQLALRFSNGEQRTYERLKSNESGAVLIVPMLDDDTVLMIYEYSAGTERYELALPKGKVDANEDLMDAANREMQEEIKYGARHIDYLKKTTLAPGYQTSITHLVLARDLYAASLPGDEPEPLKIVKRQLSTLEDWVYHDDLTEGRSIAALYLAKQYLAYDNR